MLRISLQANLYMTREDSFFVVDVLNADLTWEMVALSVINQLIGLIT
jgi:hypothetical protein